MKAIRQFRFAALGLSAITLLGIAWGQDAQSPFVVNEQSLGKSADDTMQADSLIASPDGRHVAYVRLANKRACVVLDGVAGKEYDTIVRNTITFSPDSQHLAYAAGKPGEIVLVQDINQSETFDQIFGKSVRYSPDSKRIAFLAADRGFALGLFGQGSALYFVVDGHHIKRHSEAVLNSFVFSPDSKRYAYIAGGEGNVSVVSDGKEGPHYKSISALCFSPQGDHFVYVAFGKDNKSSYLVMDGVEKKGDFDGLVIGKKVSPFSADGKHFAYVATRKKEWTVVLDDKEGPPYAIALNPLFSPDGSRFVYMASPAKEKYQTVVENGVEGQKYDAVYPTSLLFSEDSKHLAYAVRQGKERFYVVDGVRTPISVDSIQADSAVFSPDGKRFAFVGEKDGANVVITDGIAGKGYARIEPKSILFSPDSQHLVCFASRGDTMFLLADGVEGAAYHMIHSDSPVFTDATHIRFVAHKGVEDEFLRVETVLPVMSTR